MRDQAVIKLNPRGQRRWPHAPYRRAMRQRFPTDTYRQRWHAVGAFSQPKRRLGAALTARRPATQLAELRLRALTHNIMCLPCRWTTFQQSYPVR